MPLERPPAREHLEEHTPERPDIAALVGGTSPRLFRAHVGGGAQDHTHARQRRTGDRRRHRLAGRGRLRIQGLRQSEVEDLHGAIGPDFDIGWLQIAMDDALLVRRFEGGPDLPADAHRLVDRNRSLGDAIRQGRPFDELEDERCLPLRILESVNGGDVGMIQGREDLRFALEAGQPIGIAGEDVGQNFERDFAPEARVTGAKHLSHSAGAERGDDLI